MEPARPTGKFCSHGYQHNTPGEESKDSEGSKTEQTHRKVELLTKLLIDPLPLWA